MKPERRTMTRDEMKSIYASQLNKKLFSPFTWKSMMNEFIKPNSHTRNTGGWVTNLVLFGLNAIS